MRIGPADAPQTYARLLSAFATLSAEGPALEPARDSAPELLPGFQGEARAARTLTMRIRRFKSYVNLWAKVGGYS